MYANERDWIAYLRLGGLFLLFAVLRTSEKTPQGQESWRHLSDWQLTLCGRWKCKCVGDDDQALCSSEANDVLGARTEQQVDVRCTCANILEKCLDFVLVTFGLFYDSNLFLEFLFPGNLSTNLTFFVCGDGSAHFVSFGLIFSTNFFEMHIIR